MCAPGNSRLQYKRIDNDTYVCCSYLVAPLMLEGNWSNLCLLQSEPGSVQSVGTWAISFEGYKIQCANCNHLWGLKKSHGNLKMQLENKDLWFVYMHVKPEWETAKIKQTSIPNKSLVKHTRGSSADLCFSRGLDLSLLVGGWRHHMET